MNPISFFNGVKSKTGDEPPTEALTATDTDDKAARVAYNTARTAYQTRS